MGLSRISQSLKGFIVDYDDEFCAFVRAQMKEKKITVGVLAKRVGTTHCNVSRYINRKIEKVAGKPSGATLWRVMKYINALDTNLTEFERFYAKR